MLFIWKTNSSFMIVVVRKSKIFTFCGKGTWLHREKKHGCPQISQEIFSVHEQRYAGRVHDYIDKNIDDFFSLLPYYRDEENEVISPKRRNSRVGILFYCGLDTLLHFIKGDGLFCLLHIYVYKNRHGVDAQVWYLVMKDTMYLHKTKIKIAALGLCRPVFQSCHCPYELIEGSSWASM